MNAYLKALAGEQFSAKDFRTWHATVLAAVSLAEQPPPAGRAEAARATRNALGEVAAALGNTPAVSRDSYIDPRLFERYRVGATIRRALPSRPRARWSARAREEVERAVLRLLV